MLVSVCVIAYNEVEYLEDLFNDINNQTYDHSKIELILVDNGSTDSTLKAMNNFADNNDFYRP